MILHKYDELLFDYMKEVLQESGLINNEGATGNVFVLDAGCGVEFCQKHLQNKVVQLLELMSTSRLLTLQKSIKKWIRL